MVVFQFEQRRDEILLGVGVAHHDGGIGVDELLGVLGLMVFGGGGQRHEDDRLLHECQLRNRHGAGARDDHIGQAVGQIHALNEDGGLHLVFQSQGFHLFLGLGDISLARLPDELQVAVLEGGELCADAFVDAQGALAATDKQGDGFRCVELEELGRFFAGAVEGDVGPQGVAREVDLLGREPLVEMVVSHTDGFGFLAHVAVGLARIGVLLLDDGGDAEPVGGFQCGSAGEASDANHHVGLETLQDTAGFGQAAGEFEGQAEGREVLGETADPQSFDGVACLGHAFHLHAAFRSDKQDVGLGKSAFQGIGDGDGGEDMAARAAATNHDFQVLFHFL